MSTQKVRAASIEVGSLRSVKALLPLVQRLASATAANDDAALPEKSVDEVVGLLGQAIARDRRCELLYVAEDGHITARAVEPLIVDRADGDGVVLAHCCLRGEIRTFKLSRIRAVTVSSEARAQRSGVAIERFLQKRRRAM